MLSLTVSLIALPPRGWRRLSGAACPEQSLPEPTLHACAVAAASIGANLIAASLRPEATVQSATLAVLFAVNAYFGPAVLATTWLPSLLRHCGGHARERVARFASAAALPAIGCGLLILFLPPGHALLPAVLGLVLSYLSGLSGGSRFLSLPRLARHETAAITAALAGVPPIIVASLGLL